MELLLILLIVLIAAKVFSEMAEQLKLPALIGEVVAGILIGLLIRNYGDAVPVLKGLPKNEVFVSITELGIFFLMLQAGIEIHPRDFVKSSGKAIWVALGGMILPLILGVGMGWLWLPDTEFKIAQTFFLGVALAVTAVPVTVKVLLDLGKLDSKAGKIIMSAAVLDDIISLMLLAVLTGIIKTGGMPDLMSLAILVAKVVVFFGIVTAFGHYLFPFLMKRLSKVVNMEKFEFSLLLIVALIYAVLAEEMGMHFIIGAFMAGMFFVRRGVNEKVFAQVQNSIDAISTGFLAPIFFVSIGLHLELSAFSTIPLFVIVLIIAASVGKIVGAGLPALWSGLNRREALIVGNGMNARGAVELIIADIALKAGIFSVGGNYPVIEGMFSAVIITAIVTTLITPIILKLLVKEDD